MAEHTNHRHTQRCRSAADILDSTPGLSYRQLDWWTTRGYIHAIGTNRPGHGIYRCWDTDEAAVIERAARLTGFGVTASRAIQAARDPDNRLGALLEGSTA